MKIKIDCVDGLISSLKDTRDQINNVDGYYGMAEVLCPAFMSKYTQFSCIEEMLEKSGFAILEQDDLQYTFDPKFTSFVKKNTNFSCRNEMVNCAGKEFIKRRMRDL